MKSTENNSRRAFIGNSLKGGLLLASGTTIFTNIATANPLQSSGQLTQIGALGSTSLQTSQLALSKANHDKVKLFAKFEAAEQKAMAQILKDMGVTPVEDAAGKTVIAKLQQLNGAAFDKAFMQAQVETHQKLFKAVNAYQNSTKNTKVKHVSMLALGTIKEHTERGKMLLNELS